MVPRERPSTVEIAGAAFQHRSRAIDPLSEGLRYDVCRGRQRREQLELPRRDTFDKDVRAACQGIFSKSDLRVKPD